MTLSLMGSFVTLSITIFIQHNEIQHNDTQHNGLICDTQHNDIQHNAVYCYGECHLSVMLFAIYAMCHYAEYRYDECIYAECRCAYL